MGHPTTSPSERAAARVDSTALVRALSERVGRPLRPHEFSLPDGTRVGVDGADGDPPGILVQCTPLHGQLKSSHRNKVIADAFKLQWLRDTHFPQAQPVLALSTEFARLFGPGAWLPTALGRCRVSVVLIADDGNITLPDTSP